MGLLKELFKTAISVYYVIEITENITKGNKSKWGYRVPVDDAYLCQRQGLEIFVIFEQQKVS